MLRKSKIPRVEHYEQFAGRKWVERIHKMAEPLHGKHLVHINATAYGGGVAELLNSTTLMMNDLGIETGWRVLVGTHSFFKATRKMFDGLQGEDVELTPIDKSVYLDYNFRNAIINHLNDHDVVIVHDPQPLAMVQHYKKKCAWIWRCHMDVSHPDKDVTSFLKPLLNKYEAAIYHMPEYALKGLKIPSKVMPPSIDPLSAKNAKMSDKECFSILKKHGIPIDKPFILHVARFDRWKDQLGSIATFRRVNQHLPCRLILIGDMANDDPMGAEIYSSVIAAAQGDPNIIVLTERNDYLVNALQAHAAVVLQKSLREGFGLTVAEALWKETPVVGSNVGGIPLQVIDGKTGYLVRNPEEAAKRCIKIMKSKSLRKRLGQAGKLHIQKNFLITRELEDYLKIIPKYCPR